jgi:hypothetical protein
MPESPYFDPQQDAQSTRTQHLRYPALIVLLFILNCAARADDVPTRLPFKDADLVPLLRTDLFGVYIGGQKRGWERISTERAGKTQNPVFIRRNELHFARKANWAERFDSLELLVFDARPPYALLRYHYFATDARSFREITLTRHNGGFRLVYENSGETSKKDIAALDFTFADLIAPNLWARGKHNQGDHFISRLLDLEALKVQSEARTVLGTKTNVVNGARDELLEVGSASVDDTFTSRELYDRASGGLMGTRMGRLIESRREPEGIAKDVASVRDFPDELRKVKVGKPIGNPKAVTGLVLETVGMDDFPVVSYWHQTVRRNESGNFTIRLGTASDAVPVKATPQEIREALAETLAMPVNDAKVRELAAKAVGTAKQPQEKVNRLVKFVAAYIAPSYEASPLTLADLIRDRKGSCHQYALLLTALARAQGIPARVVSGLVYTDDLQKAFGYHAWTEVILDGFWVPVDASYAETEIDATHLRLDESAQLDTFGQLKLRVVQIKRKTPDQ